jgi:V-type H+-transporting ATPase subunit a
LIETIEFILGTVSNTASYLRLWALSLAHSQLAKVFFDNCLNGGFHNGSVIEMYLGFFVFMGATFGVLMCMDLLECTLHTLRLHWVEFQNKFFKGQGRLFTPARLDAVTLI